MQAVSELLNMLFTLVVSGAVLKEHEAQSALDAACAAFALADVPALLAWRDHLVVSDWLAKSGPPEMLAKGEEEGAQLWYVALDAARRALCLSAHTVVDIDLVSLLGAEGLPELHGPTRHIWRRHWSQVALDPLI